MLEYSYTITNEPIISGNERLFMMDADAIPATGYTMDADGRVTSITSYKKWTVLEKLSDLVWDTETNFDKPGALNSVEVSFGIAGITQKRQALLRALMDETRYTLIAQDVTNRYWILGERHPLSVTKLKAYNADKTGYEVKLNGTQKTQAREVTAAFMSTILVNDFEDGSSGTNTGVGPVFTPGGGGTGGGYVFNPLYFPPNNFLLTTETFVLVTSGNTIFLPLSPVPGQEITLKDSGNGSSANVLVKCSTTTLDGANINYLDTDFGSFTVIFANGKWYNKAFTA